MSYTSSCHLISIDSYTVLFYSNISTSSICSAFHIYSNRRTALISCICRISYENSWTCCNITILSIDSYIFISCYCYCSTSIKYWPLLRHNSYLVLSWNIYSAGCTRWIVQYHSYCIVSCLIDSWSCSYSSYTIIVDTHWIFWSCSALQINSSPCKCWYRTFDVCSYSTICYCNWCCSKCCYSSPISSYSYLIIYNKISSKW